MLYHLFDWLKTQGIKFAGSDLYRFLSIRVILAMILSLVITTVYGKKLIAYLRNKQLGETVRDLGLAGEQQKKGTKKGLSLAAKPTSPTMTREFDGTN